MERRSEARPAFAEILRNGADRLSSQKLRPRRRLRPRAASFLRLPFNARPLDQERHPTASLPAKQGLGRNGVAPEPRPTPGTADTVGRTNSPFSDTLRAESRPPVPSALQLGPPSPDRQDSISVRPK